MLPFISLQMHLLDDTTITVTVLGIHHKLVIHTAAILVKQQSAAISRGAEIRRVL